MQTKTVLNTVAKVVKTKRKTKGYSIAKMAAMRGFNGLSERTIRRIESGQSNYNPTLDTLVKLANGLNISVDALVSQLRG